MDKRINEINAEINTALQSEDIFKRMEAVDKLCDQPRLAQIALYDKDELVRGHAVARITDSETLAKIVRKYPMDDFVVEKAIENMTNQTVLISLMEFLKDKNTDMYRKASDAITDKDFLFSKVRMLDARGHDIIRCAVRLHDLALSDAEKNEIWERICTVTEREPSLWLYVSSALPQNELHNRHVRIEKKQMENEDQYGRFEDTIFTVYYNENEVYYGR
ncbi:hypothetical protein LJC07_02380 [Christensenellaceae bacterium OttesenSCG-928-L17]|nr:hypothetical protein [Christensenellaceae bacterium OttesenSCG-928-L17]